MQHTGMGNGPGSLQAEAALSPKGEIWHALLRLERLRGLGLRLKG